MKNGNNIIIDDWILIFSYLKTRKMKMPDSWKRVSDKYRSINGIHINGDIIEKDIYYNKFLQKEEILLNYYNLEIINGEANFDREYNDNTATSKEQMSAFESITKALDNLKEEGCIEKYSKEEWGIMLTKQGELRAKTLIDSK